MQVNTFGQHFGGNDDVYVILLTFGIVSIEVGLDNGHHFIAIATFDGNCAWIAVLFQSIQQIVGGLFTLRKNNQFALVVLCFVKKLVVQIFKEHFQLGIVIYLIPPIHKFVEDVLIVLDSFQKSVFKIIGNTDFDGGVGIDGLVDEFDKFVLFSVIQEFIDLQVWGDINGSFVEHLPHHVVCIAIAF